MPIKIFRSKIRLLVSAFLCCLTIACSGSNVKSNGGGQSDPAVNASVYISQSATLPIVKGYTGGSLYLMVNNATKARLVLTKKVVVPNQSSAIQKILSSINLSSSWSGDVDTDQCSTLAGGASCIIKITPDTSNGGGLISLDFYDDTAKHTYTAAQVFSYSDAISSVNGFYLNSNLGTIGNQSLISVAIPFVLDTNFTSLQLTTQASITSSQIICPGNNYSKGNTCTALITQHGNWSNRYQITGKIADRLMSSQSVQQTVLSGNQPNLLVSGVNVYINPSDGSSVQTISVLNTGNVTATGVAPTASSSVSGANFIFSNNNCTSLSPGTYCTFQLTVNSQVNGNGTVTINYSPLGSSIAPVFNVIFVAITPAPSLSIVTDNLRGLLNTTQNTTNSVLVTFSNNGINDLTALTFNSLPNDQFVYSTSGVSQPCALDGSQALIIGQACSLKIEYTPTSAGQNGNFVIMPKATYLDRRAQEATYQNASQIYDYTSISVSNLNFSLISGQINPQVGANGSNTSSQVWRITNSGATTATNVYMSILPTDPSGSAVQVTNNCGTSGSPITLANSESCVINVLYGPSNTPRTIDETMTVSYKPSNVAPITTTSPTPWTVTFTKAEIIATLVNNASTTWGDLTGAGTSGSPYQFVTSTGNLLRFTVKYNNVGNQDASAFNVAANQLPVGYKIYGGDCATGITTQTLAPGFNCTLILGVVESQIALYFYPTGALNTAMPGFSYTDSSTGVNQAISGLDTVYVTANSWGSVTNSVVVGPAPTHQITITFLLASIASIPGLTPVTIDMSQYLMNLKFTPNQTTCKVGGTFPNTCQITLTPEVYIPGSYNIRYLYTNNKVSNDYQVGIVSFSM